jgi:hypothetical protein
MFFMSMEVNVNVGDNGVRCNSWISSVVFFMLNEYGKGANWLIFCMDSLDNL